MGEGDGRTAWRGMMRHSPYYLIGLRFGCRLDDAAVLNMFAFHRKRSTWLDSTKYGVPSPSLCARSRPHQLPTGGPGHASVTSPPGHYLHYRSWRGNQGCHTSHHIIHASHTGFVKRPLPPSIYCVVQVVCLRMGNDKIRVALL